MYLTEEKFFEQATLDYWKPSAQKRWVYMCEAIKYMKKINASVICEAGSMGLLLNDDSFHIDISSQYLLNSKGIKHDLNVTPYPFPDKYFDCFVALQVWEHLTEQSLAFREVSRISKSIILSFPYKWKTGSKMHLGINMEKIAEWSCNTPISEYIIVKNQGKDRIVCLWKNIDFL